MSVAGRIAATATAILLAGCGGQSPSQAVPSSGTASSVPAASGLPADLAAAVTALNLPAPSGQRIAMANVQSSGDWTAITAGPSTTDSAHPIAPFTVVIGHRVNGAWQLATERDGQAFCAALAAAPTDLVTADERDYFIGCH